MGFRLLMVMILLLGLIAVSGCSSSPPSGSQVQPTYMQACLDACNSTRSGGDSLDLGPCLLDPIPGEPDWVCDVAHSPRSMVDDNPHNQCQAFQLGQAHHFVEVTPDCSLIRAV